MNKSLLSLLVVLIACFNGLQNELAAAITVTNSGRVVVSFSTKSELSQEIRTGAINILSVQVHYGFIGARIPISGPVVTGHFGAVYSVCHTLY